MHKDRGAWSMVALVKTEDSRRWDSDVALLAASPELYAAAMAALELLGEWRIDEADHRLNATKTKVFDLLYFAIRKAQGGVE